MKQKRNKKNKNNNKRVPYKKTKVKTNFNTIKGVMVNDPLGWFALIFAVFFFFNIKLFNSVQLLGCVWLFAIPWTAAHRASLFITNAWSSLKLMSIESVMHSSHLILCPPLLLLPPIPPSIRVFSNESTLRMRWPKYWSFSFSFSPSKEHPGLISFRMDWLDLLAVQGTFKSLLQHHSSKASDLQRSAFFTIQLSHPYMTIGKTIALTRWTFVGKVMSLLFNMLSQFSSVAQSCPTLCDPMNHSTPGRPVHHQLPEFTQNHVHRVGDAIQPSHLLSSPSPPALNLSQHRGLFQWVNSSHEVAKVLEFQLQHQSFQWTPRTDLL